jgi:hypothetical protein
MDQPSESSKVRWATKSAFDSILLMQCSNVDHCTNQRAVSAATEEQFTTDDISFRSEFSEPQYLRAEWNGW